MHFWISDHACKSSVLLYLVTSQQIGSSCQISRIISVNLTPQGTSHTGSFVPSKNVACQKPTLTSWKYLNQLDTGKAVTVVIESPPEFQPHCILEVLNPTYSEALWFNLFYVSTHLYARRGDAVSFLLSFCEQMSREDNTCSVSAIPQFKC